MNVLGEIPAAGSRAILLQNTPFPSKPQWKAPGCSSQSPGSMHTHTGTAPPPTPHPLRGCCHTTFPLCKVLKGHPLAERFQASSASC